jgi:hypothetical protein
VPSKVEAFDVIDIVLSDSNLVVDISHLSYDYCEAHASAFNIYLPGPHRRDRRGKLSNGRGKIDQTRQPDLLLA